MAGDGSVDEIMEPDAVFALLGNATRAEILRVLGEHAHEDVPFSKLRAEVDPTIDSGQFNYHVKQLVGHFVDHNDDGYRLRGNGLALYRTLKAGSMHRRRIIEPFDAGFACYFCGESVVAAYDDGVFEIRCVSCEHVYNHTLAPPSAVDDEDRAAVLERINQYNRHEILAFSRGVCPICVSPLDIEFVPGETVFTQGADELAVFVSHACPHCGNRQFTSTGLSVLYDPLVISFFHEHGYDLTAIPYWELEFGMTDRYTTIVSEDPWRVAVDIEVDDAVLRVVVDENAVVVESERVED